MIAASLNTRFSEYTRRESALLPEGFAVAMYRTNKISTIIALVTSSIKPISSMGTKRRKFYIFGTFLFAVSQKVGPFPSNIHHKK